MNKLVVKISVSTLVMLLCAPNVFAQSFSNTIFFGDSNTDNGRFRYLPDPTNGSTHTPGAFTTSPGLMWSQSLGARFGVTVTPSSAPGGGNNYAAGGATVATANGGNGNAIYANQWPATAQINAYLSAVGGRADPNALYTVYIGNNDLKSYFNLAPALPNLVDATVAGGAPNPLNLSQRQAALIALGFQVEHFNSASPKVGDFNFKQYYESLKVLSSSSGRLLDSIRLVNAADFVPDFPFGNTGFEHVGMRAFFEARYGEEKKNHDPCYCYGYALDDPADPHNPDEGGPKA
ncbi:SGNH/GDSL hydrolase family protein [Polynucleobacter yangtzensis]|uniref:SGNH/GDSL hydrolase family protein n=1 Tax=Polynucleobacter yangtzensis TaxID=1743159 RepID=UPI001237545A|nr:SGNH/GDSL hydrolase family protein [Polynucleobacter yangtzensis]